MTSTTATAIAPSTGPTVIDLYYNLPELRNSEYSVQSIPDDAVIIYHGRREVTRYPISSILKYCEDGVPEGCYALKFQLDLYQLQTQRYLGVVIRGRSFLFELLNQNKKRLITHNPANPYSQENDIAICDALEDIGYPIHHQDDNEVQRITCSHELQHTLTRMGLFPYQQKNVAWMMQAERCMED